MLHNCQVGPALFSKSGEELSGYVFPFLEAGPEIGQGTRIAQVEVVD